MTSNPMIRRMSGRSICPLALALAMAFPVPVVALPTMPKVINGSVTISTAGDVMTIRNSPGSVINWSSFSIARPESVIFNQASASSRVFNRVTGNNPSEILGRMQSNGQVFLINPAGIYFGKNAKIETAGLVASTLSMTDADFIAGRMRFVTTPGATSVSNDGSIITPTGGRVFLIGTNVGNHGTISTPSGSTTLAAADSIEFADSSSPGVTVSMSSSANEALNSGSIFANSGKIGVLGSLVRQQGVLSADSITREGGRIFLKATKSADIAAGSRTSASGITGGRVEIDAEDTTLISGDIAVRGTSQLGGIARLTGGNVGVTGNAIINASGVRGGGVVLVGGDYQGGNPTVRNAQFTYVGENAAILADALTQGNGGRIIVWADDSTRALGSLSVRGGNKGGDGGFAEVSGKIGLDYHARVDLRATRGRDGLLLLDPGDINILAGDGSLGGTISAPMFSTIGPGLTNLDWDDVAAQLSLGNVEVRANAGGYIAFGSGNYVSAAANKLSLLAEGNISFTNANVDLSGSLAAYAGWDGTSSSSAPLLSNPGRSISLYSGQLKAQTVTLNATGSIFDTTTAGALNVIKAQTLTAKSDSGNIYLPGANEARYASLVINSGAGDITYASSAPMVSIDASTPNGDINLSSTGGDIGLKSVNASNGAVDISADGRIFDDNGRLVTNIDAASVSLTSTGSDSPSFIAISADVVSPSIYAYVGPSASHGGIDIRQNDAAVVPTSVVLDDTSTTAGYGSIRYASQGPILLDSVYSLTSLNGRVSIQSNGTISIDAPTLASQNGSIDIHAKGSVSIVGGGLSATASAVQIGSASDVTISAPVTVNSVLVGSEQIGHLGISSSATLTVDAGLSAPDGNISLGGGSVIVTGAGGTSSPGDAKNLTVSGGNLSIEGALQAQYNVNAIAANDLKVSNGGTLAANGNISIQAGRHVIVDGSSLVADNAISIELAAADAELRLDNGGAISANQSSGSALIRLAFLSRASGGITSDFVPVVFVPGVSNGFTNNGSVATPGAGMELLYAGSYNAISGDMYGTFGDGSTACHYRGGPCGGTYSPTAYADVSIEDSFNLFREQPGNDQFGGSENATRTIKRKPGTCN